MSEKNAAELLEDVQAETADIENDCDFLISCIRDAASCETSVDVIENLTNAKNQAREIISSINEQLARLKKGKKET